MTTCNGSWVEVDLSRAAENARAIARAVEPAELMAVLKADAYGHGLVPMAKALSKAGISHFAVAYAAEAVAIRKAVPEAKLIVVLGVVDGGDAADLLEFDITPVVVSLEQAQELSAAVQQTAKAGQSLNIHLKLDTGMGRLGFLCPEEVDAAAEVFTLDGLTVTGLCTHFAMVEPVRHPTAAAGQEEKFRAAAAELEKAAGHSLFRHIASSRAALLLPEYDQHGVRIGISLYGYGSTAPGKRFQTKPVLQWKSKVVQVKRVPADFAIGYYASYKTDRETDMAVVSCGYTDGYMRLLGNLGHVLIRGRRVPVVGRISMNGLAVDLGADSGVRAGDEVVLLGEQNGEAVWADELAKHCNTIPYEILTNISRQIERRYTGA